MSDIVERFPCDGGCHVEGCPMEECSAHGRTPRELWAVIQEVQAERDEALAEVERLRPRRIETVDELDALPFLAVIREVFRPSPGSGTDYGGIYERRSSGWQCIAGAYVDPARNGTPQLPAIVLWTPERDDA